MTTRQRALAAGLLVLLGGLGVWWPTGSPVPVAPATAATAGDVPIVYSRCARTEREAPVTATVSVNGRPTRISKTLRHTDVLDVLPDVTQFFRGFSTPCDLVFRDATGTERVLYDCASRSSEASSCAALDAAVSFDARSIAFAVFRGPIERRVLDIPPQFFHPAAKGDEGVKVQLPNAFLAAQEARLHVVDVSTGVVRELPHTSGVFDSGPAWLSNGRLAFTSTRSGQFSTPVGGAQRPASQIFTMDPDGRNVEKASYHALAGEQHPLQLVDGRVALSSWQIFGMLPYRHDNGSPGGLGTLENFFHVYSQFPDGANPFPLYGQHTLNLGGFPGAAPTHFAAHFIGQSSDRRLWVADYYRGNNSGFGEIVGFPLPPDGQEGIGPDSRPHIHDVYRPKGFTSLTRWASGFDAFAGPMPGRMRIPTYRDPLAYTGKLSHPAGLPGNALLVTWGVGACSEIANGELAGDQPFTGGGSGIEAMNTLTIVGRDNPGCDAGIYRTSRIPSAHPSDLVLVVNRREYHEIMGRPVVPYAAIYGVERPAVIPRADRASAGNPDLPPGTPFGVLGASSIILRETRPLDGLTFSGNPVPFALQGTDTVDYRDEELCGIRILATQPSRDGDVERYQTTVGERVVVLGEFPVRKFDGAGHPVRDPSGAPDTSFTVRFPANTPYLMQGIDCLGRTLNTDQTWQHLRPGEVKTCNGCHVHGKAGLPFAKTAAADPGFRPVRLGEGTVPLLMGGTPPAVEVAQRPGYGIQFEYERDVFPILQRRCAACHSGAQAAAGLVLDRPGTEPGSTYDRLVMDAGQRFVPAGRRFPHPFAKPQLTKYTRALNARGSLLYWKAVNQRTDGRTDRTYTAASGPDWEDVDFGPPHPTGITPDELAILSRWLDTGAAAAREFLRDTTPPALNLTAAVEGSAVTRLFIGTVDVPTGIAEDSLQVCIADRGGHCTVHLAPKALPHGIATVPLPQALTDPDIEIRVRVRDRAGNQTEERRTVRWLLDNAVPGPARVSLGPGRAGRGKP
jgi:Hydrazine synthase alpha subunit middle domain